MSAGNLFSIPASWRDEMDAARCAARRWRRRSRGGSSSADLDHNIELLQQTAG